MRVGPVIVTGDGYCGDPTVSAFTLLYFFLLCVLCALCASALGFDLIGKIE
jgi:hypothetical protein